MCERGIKLLYWDGQGFCLYYKVLERGRFPWPTTLDGSARLTSAQLAMLWAPLGRLLRNRLPGSEALIGGGRTGVRHRPVLDDLHRYIRLIYMAFLLLRWYPTLCQMMSQPCLMIPLF